MKSVFRIILLVLIFSTGPALAEMNLPPKPAQQTYVNDFAHALTTEQVRELDAKLYAYKLHSDNEVVIVTVKSTQPYEIADYAVQLGRKWGVGVKDKNNGVVLLWATVDRKIFIATGYGVEGDLTDAVSKRIIEQDIIPDFKAGKFYIGLDDGTNSIIKVLSGEEVQVPNSTDMVTNNIVIPDYVGKYLVPGFLIFYVFLAWVMRKQYGGFFKALFMMFFQLLFQILISGLFNSGRSYGGGSSRGGFGGGSFGGGGAGGSY